MSRPSLLRAAQAAQAALVEQALEPADEGMEAIAELARAGIANPERAQDMLREIERIAAAWAQMRGNRGTSGG